MTTLKLILTSGPSSADVLAEGVLDVQRLSPQSPLWIQMPLRSVYGEMMGCVEVGMSLVLPSWRPEREMGLGVERLERMGGLENSGDMQTPMEVFRKFEQALAR